MDRTEGLKYEASFAKGRDEAIAALEGRGPIFAIASLTQIPGAWAAMYGDIGEDGGYHVAVVVDGKVHDDRLFVDGGLAWDKVATLIAVSYMPPEQVIASMPKFDFSGDPERQAKKDRLANALLRASRRSPIAEA